MIKIPFDSWGCQGGHHAEALALGNAEQGIRAGDLKA
jgi:hypothetical protein